MNLAKASTSSLTLSRKPQRRLGGICEIGSELAGAVESVAYAINRLADKTANIAEMLDLHSCGRQH
jgi:hypothetical protein